MNRRTDYEPVRGLPERLPPGERLLWQCAPAWKTLCRRLFRFPLLLAYFAVLVAWRVASSLDSGAGTKETVATTSSLIALALVAFGLLASIAWLIERTTVYTITDKRIVVRFGIALPMTINLPFKAITAAELRLYADGMGDIPVTLSGAQRIGHLVLWPHARPWRWRQPEPMLRCVPDAATIAELLAEHLTAAAEPAKRTTPRSGFATPHDNAGEGAEGAVGPRPVAA